MNYSQFLEVVLRIAYHKLDESEQTNANNGFKNVLENIFQEGKIDIKRRIMEDRLISELYSYDNCKIFFENFSLLASIFTQRGMIHLETFLELSKDEFIHILQESGILVEG